MSSDSAEFDYDVIIVGGGPAGVSCAITVAQAGYKVVIVDKKSRERIGDKTCGDAIDKAALLRLNERIGLELPSGAEVSDPITKMSIAADDIDIKLSLDAPGFQVNRLIYGQRLLKDAEKLGVEVISDAPVRGILTEEVNGETYLTGIKYRKDGEEVVIRGKFTIDASGAYAAIRKELPDEFLNDGIKRELDDDELWPTYREIIQLKSEVAKHRWRNEIILMYDDDYPPPGYFWLFTEGEGALNFGIGWEKTQDLGKLKEKLHAEMAQYFSPDQYDVIARGGGQIPFRPPFDSLVFNGGALAGDAACMVHPVTAEGHGPALDTASHLGTSIISALKDDRRDRDSLWGYNVNVAHHYGEKHMAAHTMKEMLRSVGADGLKFLIEKEIFKEEELNLIFAGTEITNAVSNLEKLKRLLKLFMRPSLLLHLKKLLTYSNRVNDIYQAYPTNPEDLANWRKERNEALNVSF
ncbi:MAG: NAD(P)/FAD-dependent oxidoreductase [Candidatus Kariarchaeaceae archaeon]|jgi:geranylgeranyl reductase family protein